MLQRLAGAVHQLFEFARKLKCSRVIGVDIAPHGNVLLEQFGGGAFAHGQGQLHPAVEIRLIGSAGL